MPIRWEPVSAMVGVQVIGGSLLKVVNAPMVGASKPGIRSIRSMQSVESGFSYIFLGTAQDVLGGGGGGLDVTENAARYVHTPSAG